VNSVEDRPLNAGVPADATHERRIAARERLTHADSTSFHASTAANTLQALASAPDGLASLESARRLQVHGPNELPAPRTDPFWLLIARQLRSPIALLLVAGVALSLFAGDQLDAIAISAVLLLNTAIGGRWRRCGRATHSRRDAASPSQRRRTRRSQPPSRPRRRSWKKASIPADLACSKQPSCDQRSAVTGDGRGEKDAVAVLDPHTPLAERRNMAYQGCAVAAGRGRAIVVATGASTELGRIGALVEQVRPGQTSLERKLGALGMQLAIAAIVLALVVMVLGLVRGMPLDTLVRLGIALAVATVPEGLPAVATIALAIGVRRMARRRALVRQLPVVESLGSVTVVCADKTGTLTAGAMTVTSMWCAGRTITVTGSGFEPRGEFLSDGARVDPAADAVLGELLRSGAQAARATVDEKNGVWLAIGDPTDAALVTVAGKAGLTRALLLREEPLAWEIPFSSARMLSLSAHHRDGIRVYVKGSPRTFSNLLHPMTRRDPVHGDATRVERANESLAQAGLRVLAIALVTTAESPCRETSRSSGWWR
jgi:magnesium-transporting ATPase (P-type)